MEKKSTKSGYRPSDSVKKRIAAWEGSAMTGAIDPLSGKWGKNRTFEEEASSFYHALPADIREQVISNPGLADNLFSYSYNVGAGRFKERVVPALRKYYAGKGSAEEIASSMWASGDKKLRGLRNRRAVERQGVVDSLAPSPIQPVFDVPTDNTFVFNPFPIHAEGTTVAPIMVPDTYVEAHRLTPSEDRVNRFQEAMEARRQYNNLMDAISIQNNPAPQYTPQNNPANAPYVVASYDKGGYLRKSWNDLSMSEKAEMMKVAVRNGITNLQDIRDKYNEFAGGGGISDEKYYSTMEKVAEDNYQKWGLSSPDEALVHALNDNTYNYRGYYDAYPQSTADASTHWPDEFKTVYHPTFSDESKYSGQRSQYNPLGLTGGYWVGDTFIPRAWQMLDSNKHSIGGPLVEAAMNEYRNGGKIHIKPSHRGRLTDLKKRTGKTEAELYRTGNPATRKMITFARNARKWKHGLGGNLYPGGGFIGLMPAMPGIAIDSNAAENIATTASKKVMNYIKGAHDTGSYFSYDPSMEAYTGPAQDTYLLPRKLQEKEFLRRGYIKGKDKDYGLVKMAVGDRDLPVYQRNPDAITRDNLTVIGNIHGWDPWYGSTDTALEHPGSYPTAVYTDAEGNFFQKGWDLNDYGGKTGSTIGFLSDIVDRIGSPTVVTTGYQPVSNPQDKNFIQAITPMMAKKGLVPTEINGKTEWALPEVTITGKKKKSFGGNLFYPGGEITYGRPYYSYDTNGRRINDTLNYNASIPDIVITPDSKKSPGERAVLERQRRTSHDATYGKGTYDAIKDREWTALQQAVAQKEWENSAEKAALDYGQAIASGIGMGADIVSRLPIYSSLKGASVLNRAETPLDYAEGAMWLTPIAGATYQAAKPVIQKAANEAAIAWALRSPEVPVGYLTTKPQVRTKIGDIEIDNPNLLYHLDRGNRAGAFSSQGAYVEDGILFPGVAKKEGQLGYSWWNKGKPYATSVNGQPMTRLMTTTEDAPGMLHVRSQNYPIGQWNGKRGLVFNSEYVNPEGVNVSNRTYTLDPDYGWRRVFAEESPAAEWPIGRTTSQITAENAASVTPKQWTAAQDAAIARGDMAEAQRLRDLHFRISAPNSAAVGEDGFPLDLFHGTRTAKGIKKNGFSAEMSGKGNRGADEGNTYLTNSYENAVYTGVKAHEVEPIIDKVSSVYDLFGSKTIPSLKQIYSQTDNLSKQSSEIKKQLYKLHTGTVWDKISTSLGLKNSPSNKAKELQSIISSNDKEIEELNRRAHIVGFLDDGLSYIGGNRDRAVVNTLNFIKEPVNPASPYRQVAADRIINAMYGTTDQVYSPEVLRFYGNFESPLLSDFKMAPTDVNPLKTGKWSSIQSDYNNREKALLQELAKPQYDSSISKNKFDILFGDVYIAKKPNSLKLANAVTYGDDGIRIPLGERDNFKLNDIRYSWLLPFIGLGTLGTMYGTNQKALGGNMIVNSQKT